MVDDILERDLFGAPLVERSGGRGRPRHVWSLANSNRVLLAFVLGRSVPQAAKLIGVSEPTLRKVYFKEVGERELARDRMDVRQLERLHAAAEAGNVSAEKEFAKMRDRIVQRDVAQIYGTPAPKQEKLGKKAAAAKAAEAVRGLYEPPPPPSRLN